MALCCVMMFMVAFSGGGGVAFAGENESEETNIFMKHRVFIML